MTTEIPSPAEAHGLDQMRRDLVADTREVFDAHGSATPQTVRDVIEYVDSWLHVQVGRAADRANVQPKGTEPAPMSPSNRLVAYTAAAKLRELGYQWDAAAQGWTTQAPAVRAEPMTIAEVQDLVRDADLDWHRGWNGDPLDVNRYLTLVRSVERHCYGLPKPPVQGSQP